jgi:hypothetical protein
MACHPPPLDMNPRGASIRGKGGGARTLTQGGGILHIWREPEHPPSTLGTTLGSRWGHAGVTLGSRLGHAGVTLGFFDAGVTVGARVRAMTRILRKVGMPYFAQFCAKFAEICGNLQKVYG